MVARRKPCALPRGSCSRQTVLSFGAICVVSAIAFSPSPLQVSRIGFLPLQESLWDKASDFIVNNTSDLSLLDEAAIDCEVADGVPPAKIHLENLPPLLVDQAGSSSSSSSSNSNSNSLFSLALAGALASAIGDGSMHPMDTIKTLQQSDAGYGLSLIQAAQFVFEQSGWIGFYAGFFTYAVSDAMGGSLKFVTFELGKQWTRQLLNSNDDETNTNNKQIQQSVSLFACAALAFVASSVVVVPGELLKQQLQMNYYGGLPQAIMGILEQDGLRGFYTGYSGVFLRDIPYTMLELGLYDLFKSGLVSYKQQQQKKKDYEMLKDSVDSTRGDPPMATTATTLSTMEEILAAALTGGIAGYFTTPFDTIKTKVMVDQQLYDGGFIDCFWSTLDQHGFAALFAGGTARVAWLVPFTAIYLPVYDILKRRFSRTMPTFNPSAEAILATPVDTKAETETEAV